VEEEVPEGIVHLRVRTFLWQLLEFVLGPEHTVGSDQFLYWNARDPRRCLSPDVFVRQNTPQSTFDSWKCWERGAPQLAVEIISPNDWDGIEWQEKVLRYHEIGVLEMLRYDPEADPGTRIRAWDRTKDDFVERGVEGERTACRTLGLEWVVASIGPGQDGLRLASADGTLLLSKEEALVREREAQAAGRAAAEARVRELEEELRKRGG
jgi:Uma2 family endonuclease